MKWPIIPIHMALTPSGDVMSYGTTQTGAQGGNLVYDVWNPATGAHSVKSNTTPTDIFCAAQVIEPNSDQVLTAGGDNSGPGNAGNPGVTLYSDATGSIEAAGQMNKKRWYPTANVLPSGEIVVEGGSFDGFGGLGVKTPEIRRADGSWDLLTGAKSSAVWGDEANNSWWYPRSWVAPDGRLFGIAAKQMYWLDPSGNGSVQLAGSFPGANTMATSTAVMYRPGKILQVGGGAPQNGGGPSASGAATIIDINGPSPKLTQAAALSKPRHWATSTVLADGTVLVTGGAAGNNSLQGVAYTPELWDPDTNTWTTLAPAKKHRLYHSAAILLPDGRVLTGGGGAPGPTNNLDAQIFSPPYLFKADGSPAPRPKINSAPSKVAYGSKFTVGVSAGVTKFALVRAGAVTHSFNNGQRYIPLTATGTGTSRTVDCAIEWQHLLAPGTYLLFALNGAGTPSVAALVDIDPVTGPTPPPSPGGVKADSWNFEGGEQAGVGGWVNYAAGSSFGRWSVTSPVSKDHAAHHGGNGSTGHHIDLDDNGSITSTAKGLTAGQSHTLTFQTAKHFALDADPSAKVTIAGSTKNWSASNSSKGPWKTVTLTFTPSGSTAKITFTGTSSPVGWGGVLIDNPTITTSSAPPPSPGGVKVDSWNFEGGEQAGVGGWVNYAAGSSFGRWSVTSPVSKDHAAHHGGNGSTGHHIDLDDNGSITSTAKGLTAGQSHTLTFQTAKHFALDADPSAKVTIAGSTKNWSASNSSKGPWKTVTLTFTPSGSTAKITFTGTSSPVGWGGVLIDNPTISN